MPTEPTDHASEAKYYLAEGLNSIEIGNISDAIENFLHAAIELERAQDFRQIPAVWEAIGKLLEKKTDDINQSINEKWPIDYHTMEIEEWHEQLDKTHKLAWVYLWAAEHRERAGEPQMAYPLFFKSATKAQYAKIAREYPTWPAELYRRAVINFIRTYGTIEHAPLDVQFISRGISDRDWIKDGIEQIEIHYQKIEDKRKRYELIAIAYRLLKLSLIEKGNLPEAELYRTKERSALMHYYFHNKKFHRAIAEYISGKGFRYLMMLLFFMIFIGFPYLYYSYNLIASTENWPTWITVIIYSTETALIMGHDNLTPIGIGGRLLTIIETALSFFGLGVFIWRITKRLE